MQPLPMPKSWDPNLSHSWEKFDAYMREAAEKAKDQHQSPLGYFKNAKRAMDVQNTHLAYRHLQTAVRLSTDPRWLVFQDKVNDDFHGFDEMTIQEYKRQLDAEYPLIIPADIAGMHDVIEAGLSQYQGAGIIALALEAQEERFKVFIKDQVVAEVASVFLSDLESMVAQICKQIDGDAAGRNTAEGPAT